MRLSRIGSQIAAMATIIMTSAFGSHGQEISASADIEISRRRASAGAFENEQRHAAPDESRGQRGHNIGNAGEGDNEAVQQSGAGAGDQHDDREGQGLAKVGVLHETRGEDVRHRDHRADREIDAAADDNDRLRGGSQSKRQGAQRQGLNLERTEIGMNRDGRSQRRDEQKRHAEKS